MFTQQLVGTRKIKNLSRQKCLELLGVAVNKSITEVKIKRIIRWSAGSQ